MPDQQLFYLRGGTALAEFYLGHRLSFDLDFFTVEGRLILPFSRALELAFKDAGWMVRVPRRFASYVELVLHRRGEEVRIDLGQDTPFRYAKPLESEYGIVVNDFDDLRAEKVLAYYGRGEPRDAVDLYLLAESEEDRRTLLDLAARKDPGFDRYWFAVALSRAESFPEELDRWPVKMLLPFDPRDLKSRFRRWAMALMESRDHP